MTPARDPNQRKKASHLEKMGHRANGESTNKSIPPIYACRMKDDEVRGGKRCHRANRENTNKSIYLTIDRSIGLLIYVCIYLCI